VVRLAPTLAPEALRAELARVVRWTRCAAHARDDFARLAEGVTRVEV
jgi:hypothetical protein